MSLEPDNLQMLISKYRTMNIEELKASIDYLQEDNTCFDKLQSLDIAKNELDKKHKERQEHIELLTESLTSSSRIGRWISAIKAVFR